MKSTLDVSVTVELAALLPRYTTTASVERASLEALADRLLAIAKRPDVASSPLARRLVAMHDDLASHLLAAFDFDLAGLAPERTERLLERARRRVTSGLLDVLDPLAS